VELLKETVPRLSRVAVLGSSTTPGNAQALKETELAAGALGVKLQNLDVLGPKDIETAFRAAGKEQADAVLVLSASVLNSHGTEIAKLAVKSRLPAIYPFPEMWKPVGLWPTARALLTCSGALRPYVDKILNGANAADLPVEQPKKFECH